LGLTTYNQLPASVFDTRAPAAPFVPSDDASYSGGLLGRLTALAGTRSGESDAACAVAER